MPSAGEGERALSRHDRAAVRAVRDSIPPPAPALAAGLVALGPERHGLVLAVSGAVRRRGLAGPDRGPARATSTRRAREQRGPAGRRARPVRRLRRLAGEPARGGGRGGGRELLAGADGGGAGPARPRPGSSPGGGLRAAEVAGSWTPPLVERLGDGAADIWPRAGTRCCGGVPARADRGGPRVRRAPAGRPRRCRGRLCPSASGGQRAGAGHGVRRAGLEQVRQAAGEAGERQGFFGVTGSAEADELALAWQLEWRAAARAAGVGRPGPAHGGRARDRPSPCAQAGVPRQVDGAIELALAHDPDRVPAARARSCWTR